MKNKKPLVPKKLSEIEELQLLRSRLERVLNNPNAFMSEQDRAADRVKLIEVKRSLNRLYAAKQ
jgi:hypothetical protein